MQKRFIRPIVVIMCLAVLGTSVVRAQDTHKLEVEIPFPFVLQDRELPAGKYRLERIDPSKPNLLMIKNTDVHFVRIILTERVEKEAASTATYLLFRRREEKLYLFQVWTTGAINGIQIPSSDDDNGRAQRGERTSVVRLNAKAP